MSVYMAADSDSDRQLGDMRRRRLYMNGKHARSAAETGRAMPKAGTAAAITAAITYALILLFPNTVLLPIK